MTDRQSRRNRRENNDRRPSGQLAELPPPPTRITHKVKPPKDDKGRTHIMIQGVRTTYCFLRGFKDDPGRCKLTIFWSEDTPGAEELLDTLEDQIGKVIDAGDFKKPVDPEGDKQPLHLGDQYGDEVLDGMWYMAPAGAKGVKQADGEYRFSTPVISKRALTEGGRPGEIGKGDFEMPESGDYVNVTISFWAQDQSTKQASQYGERVNCSLEIVQLHCKGEKLGGGAPSVSELAEEYEADMSSADL